MRRGRPAGVREDHGRDRCRPGKADRAPVSAESGLGAASGRSRRARCGWSVGLKGWDGPRAAGSGEAGPASSGGAAVARLKKEGGGEATDERARAVSGVRRGRGDALAAWEQAGACGPGVRAGRSGRGELGRAGGSGPSERGVSWAGERKGRLGCCWAGVGPREGRGRPGLRWVWGLLGLGLGWVKGLGLLFPTLLLSKSNSSKV